MAWVQISAPCVTLVQFHSCSVPQYSHLKMGLEWYLPPSLSVGIECLWASVLLVLWKVPEGSEMAFYKQGALSPIIFMVTFQM